MTLVERIAVARGDLPRRLALRNAQLVNVLSGEIYPTDIVSTTMTSVALAPATRRAEIDLTGATSPPA